MIRRGWEAWLRGDMHTLAADWDPEVIWSTEHFHDWPESAYRGVEGVMQFLNEWLDVWGTMRSMSMMFLLRQMDVLSA